MENESGEECDHGHSHISHFSLMDDGEEKERREEGVDVDIRSTLNQKSTLNIGEEKELGGGAQPHRKGKGPGNLLFPAIIH